MEEIEVKFLNIDPEKIQKKLLEVGATKIGEFFQKWKAFDYPDWQGEWIRLRDEGDGRITLSYKKRLGMKDRDASSNDAGMEEIEIHVDNFEKTSLFLEKAGLVYKHYAEKKRIRWEKDRIEFDIDIYPELEPYLEIEAESWEKIDSAINLLGLNPEDRKIFSANQAYALKGIKIEELKEITFDRGLIKK